MKIKIEVIDWFEQKGKIWLFRILTISILAIGIVEEINLFGWFSNFKTPIVILAVPAILFLLLEIFIATVSRLEERIDESLKQAAFNWADSVKILSERIQNAQTIDIIAHTADTFYSALRSSLEVSHVKRIRILASQWDGNNTAEYHTLLQTEQRWRSIKTKDKGFSIDFRYCANDLLRGVVIDESEGFFGYYSWNEQEKRLRGFSNPLLHLTRQTETGEHLVNMYSSRFEYFWNLATELKQPIETRTGDIENKFKSSLHIFPAEKITSDFELKLMSQDKNQTFHPELVTLLEDQSKFRLFVFSCVYGLIKTHVDKNGNMLLKLKITQKRRLFNLAIIRKITNNKNAIPSLIFQGIQNFTLRGIDVIDEKQKLDIVLIEQQVEAQKLKLSQEKNIKTLTDVLESGLFSHLYKSSIDSRFSDLGNLIKTTIIDEVKSLRQTSSDKHAA